MRFSASTPLEALRNVAIERSGAARYRDEVTVTQPEPTSQRKGKFGTWSGFSWRHDASMVPEKKIDVLDLELGTVGSRRFLHLSRRRSDGLRMLENVELLLWID